MKGKSLNLLERLFLSFFGSGYLPKAPGTYGSIAACSVLVIPEPYLTYFLYVSIPTLFFLSIPVINKAELNEGSDPSWIVIDEVLGMWIIFAYPFIPTTWLWVLFGLLLFRYFDIFKPSIIGKLNDKRGGFFVMADDILAALFTLICLQIFAFSYQILSIFWLILSNL